MESTLIKNQFENLVDLGEWDYLLLAGKQKGDLFSDVCLDGNIAQIISMAGSILRQVAEAANIPSEEMGAMVNKAWDLDKLAYSEGPSPKYNKTLKEYYALFEKYPETLG